MYFCSMAAWGLAWAAPGFRAFSRDIWRYWRPTDATTSNRNGMATKIELWWESSFSAKSIPNEMSWP